MTGAKKKRMSMLDNLAAAQAPSPATVGSQMSTNRALRSARDAVDSHHVWELDPDLISDHRLSDRLDPNDIHDLRDAIEANGQTVPILVRRDPKYPERFLLVYGRRRLEAIRNSDKVEKVRALVANVDDDAAVRAQISENMARRDLSFIEKALFAQELIGAGFGNQSQVAEVLTVTKSSISMALGIVEMVGEDLIRAIGPAHGVGRPKWEALGKAIEESGANRAQLEKLAEDIHTKATVDLVVEGPEGAVDDVSLRAFDAVFEAVGQGGRPAPKAARSGPKDRALLLSGQPGGTVKRTGRGLSLTLNNGPFADWIEAEAQTLIEELHARWQQHAEE